VGIQARAMEGVGMNAQFWRGRRVLLTGHTGFKGSWLSLWLQKLGANVAGYALPAESAKSLFELAEVGKQMESVYADIRNLQHLRELCERFQPEVVFHFAAQSLVRRSYLEPIETYQVNVMGTVHLLEAVRSTESCRAVVNITSDKCYENREWTWGYRESDQIGGHDPYSSSKGCAELVTAAYRLSFFEAQDTKRVAVATARAGNVIGGGDFSKDRIVPDFMAAMKNGNPLYVRNPDAVRPWQHVLEPLSGYLLLAEKLWNEPAQYAQGWNFGPSPDDVRSVRWIVEKLNEYSGKRISWEVGPTSRLHEAHLLVLDSAKARMMLDWKPRWTLEQALKAVVRWHNALEAGESLRDVVIQQITSYEATGNPHSFESGAVANGPHAAVRASGREEMASHVEWSGRGGMGDEHSLASS
jgi:CDP-glucose 4,6-dehydratase